MKPNNITKKTIQYVKGKKVLYLGVGDGRDVLFLARSGFQVTCIDKFHEVLERVKKITKIRLELIQKNIEDFSYTKKYNAIFCLNVLHLIKKENISKIISSMKSNTLKEGINVVQALTTEDSLAKTKIDFGYLKPNELKEYYKDWHIIYYSEYITDFEKHKGNQRLHRHHLAEIIAIKE